MSKGQIRQDYPGSGGTFDYQVEGSDDSLLVDLDGKEIQLSITTGEGQEGWCRTTDGKLHQFFWVHAGNSLQLWLDGNHFIFRKVDTRSTAGQGSGSRGVRVGSDILAPMPGIVEKILVGPGDTVEQGETVAIMESMKMELEINSPRAGIVKSVSAEVGAQVNRGMRLLELEDLA